ncbi:MAG: hypothetical protein EXR52_08060 [Dehalococcoidia bacterium]|nr:hypothetical protein [Dehalococcoidia bacterium]
MPRIRIDRLRWVLPGFFTSVLLLLPAVRLAEAAGIVVSTHIDVNPPVTDGACTLREAIVNVNANAATFPDCGAGAGADTITFASDMVITLVASLPDITDAAGTHRQWRR